MNWYGNRASALFAMMALSFGFSACKDKTPPAAESSLASTAQPASQQPQHSSPRQKPVASFVGSEGCADCHAQQVKLLSESHHARAMKVADKQSIVAELRAPVHSKGKEPHATIKPEGESFVVRTQGASGKVESFAVRYTFGFFPLQQYLVDAERGRLQPLRLAWDSRPQSGGGGRWFSLYAGQDIPPGDILHFSGPNQNYNGMCADCHSTNLRRGYDADKDRFDTSWTEISVGCEACHGPASAHLAWVKLPVDKRGTDPQFERRLVGASAGSWKLEGSSAIAKPSPSVASATEIDACAPCHSRRSMLKEQPGPPSNLLDLLRPELALAPLYKPDGQVDDEVYVWGSFTQSKMHHAGVTCSNCHDPHSGALLAQENALCGQCHSPAKFDSPTHHFHPDGAGSKCISCHMPEKTYMEVDARRDHSFRIPRPELSVAFSVPNACNSCHQQKTKKWAVEAYEKNWGQPEPLPAFYLAQGQRGDPATTAALLDIATASQQPIMLRATALVVASQLPGAGRPLLDAVTQLSREQEPLVRLAAVQASSPFPPSERVKLLRELLRDGTFAVRSEAMRALLMEVSPQDRAALLVQVREVFSEYRDAQRAFLDRAPVRLSLAGMYLGMGQMDEAEKEFVAALKLDQNFVPTVVNYADFLRQQGRDKEAIALLDQLLERVPDAASAWYALGLGLIRNKEYGPAAAALNKAVDLAPGEPTYVLALALVLDHQQNVTQAILTLDRGLQESPWAAELHQTRVQLLTRPGDNPRLRSAVEVWLGRLPTDPGAQAAAGRFLGAGPGAPR